MEAPPQLGLRGPVQNSIAVRRLWVKAPVPGPWKLNGAKLNGGKLTETWAARDRSMSTAAHQSPLQSIRTPLSFTTFDHFSNSCAMKVPKSGGDLAKG